MSALLNLPQLKNFGRNTKYSGLTPFNYTPRGTEQELDCWLEVEPAQKETRIDPGFAANAMLCYAEVNGNDILELLNNLTIEEIQVRFLEQEGKT